jgi:hypothetical protein
MHLWPSTSTSTSTSQNRNRRICPTLASGGSKPLVDHRVSLTCGFSHLQILHPCLQARAGSAGSSAPSTPAIDLATAMSVGWGQVHLPVVAPLESRSSQRPPRGGRPTGRRAGEPQAKGGGPTGTAGGGGAKVGGGGL